jgi:hypothetical protein
VTAANPVREYEVSAHPDALLKEALLQMSA